MELNNLDLATIHPRNGAKFSPNLHKFLASEDRSLIRKYGRVYRDNEDTLWLGYQNDGYLMGSRLMQALCLGGKAPTFAYSLSDMAPLVELEGFWAQYQAHGRCAVDPEHLMTFVGDETRWAGDDEQRACLWCGNVHQTRERWVEQVPRERWVVAGASPQP